MKIILKYSIYLLITAVFISPFVFATPDTSPSKDAQRLIALFTQFNSLETGFEQITLDAGGSNLQVFTGKLRLQKPLSFYYETDPPHNQIILLKQNEVWLYDKDLEQVTVQPFDQQFSQTPIMLIIKPTLAFLQKHFTVKAGKRSSGGQQQFELTPLAKDQLYKKMRFHFIKDNLYEIQLEDNIGQKTVMTFYDDAVYNRPIEAEQFQLELPEGVDVLR